MSEAANGNTWPEALPRALARGDVLVRRARGSALARCLASLRNSWRRPLLVVAPDPEIAGDIQADIRFYLPPGSPAPLFWPAWDILPFETDQPDVDVASDQVTALRACLTGQEGLWLIAPVTALLQPTLSPKIINSGGLAVAAGVETSPEALVARLVEGGLDPTAAVDAPGQFSRRGGILDVFPLLGDAPYRLEFFGDVVETIRSFDPATQRSGPPLAGKITLVDVSRDAFRQINGSPCSLLDYLPEETAVLLWHPDRVTRVAGLYAGGFTGASSLLDFTDVAERLSLHPLAVFPDLDDDAWPDPPWREVAEPQIVDFAASGWERLSGGFESAVAELSLLAAKKTELVIACNNDGEEKRLRQMLAEKNPALLKQVEIRRGHLSRGFVRETPGGGEAFVSDHELFGRSTPVRSARKRFAGAPIADFAELREGDYVVHVSNGIARFEGIRTLERNGAEQDFLTLRFAEDARIYVPLTHIDLVQRYIGLGERKPQLSKLGSAAWSRKKEAAEKAVRDIAQDLLATQAKRLSSLGVALPPDDTLVEEFDASFPYDETPDQLAAIDDIRRDQQSEAPMERLLCGDVGFGKTEMAIRAAFRVANAGKQAAVLVPTTILAEQHYHTFSTRMADYPVTVECLSRFRSPQEQKRIVESVRDGRTDIVVGTHRLLSEDVAFKDLGLVVIDEEQKFGVEAKERLKRFRADVDILTMTATPIPRTLHMSMLGLRDISNLATPPRERHSVKTMVVRWSKEVVRRAILRELSRGGQCFFLHNRVHNIDETAASLRQIVPEARFGIGHGQMGEGELLEIMQAFLDHRIDVLVCTTIIESGVDIPNVNTLFVNEADHFGLSELHQLRGRVGRYKHQAYAYFLVPEKRPISPEATKRLQALQEYAELGAGFRIAMRDLEIRGAGNLLGVEQSGHIHLIGFDLYCRLLEKAVAAEKGVELEDELTAELDLGTRAFIPPEYIPAEQQRIEFYRRLTRIRTREALESEHRYVRDRYGVPPPPVERCFRDQAIRIRMLETGVESLARLDAALTLNFSDEAARRNVMLLRHAGLKISPLRQNQWRVEVPGVAEGVEPGDQAAGMADKALGILEAGGAARSRPARAKPSRPAKAPLPAAPDPELDARRVSPSAKEEKRPVAPAVASSRPAPAPPARAVAAKAATTLPPSPPPSPPPPSKMAESGHMNFFSSDMLESESDSEPEPTPAKKKGKSGAKARKSIGAVLREEGLVGGARKTAKMPETVTKPAIVALRSPGKTVPAKPKAPPSPPPAAARREEKKDIVPEAANGTGWVSVLGVEPFIASGQVGAVVPASAFQPLRFGTMTLAIKSEPERRFFLRCVGSGEGSGGRATLRLKAGDSTEAKAIAESFLAAGAAELFDGVSE